MNHRAVIETLKPTGFLEMHVLAAGPPDYCQRMLREYVRINRLASNQKAMILKVISSS